jgi:23S rRNA (cytosine1962-C5)-methyltransferase
MSKFPEKISLYLRPHKGRESCHCHAGEAPRVLAGHPWVFAGELAELPQGVPQSGGDTASLYDARGHFLGSGVYNPLSKIAWRRYSFSDEDLSCDFMRRALERAIHWREKFGMGDTCRLVWAESDALPGLIVDRYGDILVVQTQTRALDARLPVVTDVLQELLQPRAVIVRNESKVRALEGLSCEAFLQSGVLSPDECAAIDDVKFHIDFLDGQKTGLYLDQRGQYVRVARHAKGRRVLDAFCNQGGFALFAARGGAKAVTAVDSSEPALRLLRRNAKTNGLGQIEAVQANVFDFFHEHKDARWDLIILDPPPFAPAKKQVESALRGYKELNLRAAACLNRGGILATYSCSHHVGLSDFTEVVRSAFADAGRSAHILEYVHQPPDHPILLDMPESEYLSGLIVECD